MPLGLLKIAHVRCLSAVDIDLGCADSYFFGPNGAGKTSLLESIYLLSRGRSFRTRDTRKLLQKGATGLAVFGEVRRGSQVHRLGVAYAAGKLEKKRDGQPAAAGMAELAAMLPVHVIDPSSHQLLEGGPNERRRFLDWGVFHVEHTYLDAWRRYRRVLSQRNAALKAGAGGREVNVWTAAVADAGEAVDQLRSGYVDSLGAPVRRLGEALLGQPLLLEYRRGWPAGMPLAGALQESARQERLAGHTLHGPHRADLEITAGSGDAVRDQASRGQQKLAAAALVLAQVERQSADDPRGPVLLIDDPAAELDRDALERLRDVLTNAGAQLVMTSLSEEQLAPPKGARVFHVEQGAVQRVL